MEKKTVITNQMNEKQILDTYLLFEYKCLEKKQQGKKIIFEFERDDSVSYIKELRNLEYQYGSYKVGSMLPTTILPIISFVLFTVFLVLMFALGDNFNLLLYFLTLVLPALIFLALSAVLMVLRIRSINKIENEKPLKDQEYRQKIEKLKK